MIRRVKAPRREKIGKTPKLIFNNPRSSIKPESAPDPQLLAKLLTHVDNNLRQDRLVCT